MGKVTLRTVEPVELRTVEPGALTCRDHASLVP